jgi:hypothetical protein
VFPVANTALPRSVSAPLRVIRVPKGKPLDPIALAVPETNPSLTYFIRMIHVDCRHYTLREPLPVRAYKEDGLWVAENDEFNLHAYGPTFDEAFQMLDERFDVIYQRVATAANDSLSDKMRAVRDRLRALVLST